MRNATKQLCMSGANDDIRLSPRIAIWENVPGAFSSNNGEDFRCVLEELARIENPEVSIPKPKKWMPSGCIELPCGCITWRTHDAQYWGVPQRRKRISLIVDFRDEPEPEIQLVSRSVSGNTAESDHKGEEVTGTVGEGIDTAICPKAIIKPLCIGNGQLHDALTPSEKCKTLNTMDDPMKVVCVGNGQLAQAELSEKVGALNCMHDQQAIICPTNEPILLESNQDHATVQTDGVSTTLPASMGMGGGYVPMVVDQGGGKSQANVSVDLSLTLTTTHGGEPAVCQEVFSNVHAATGELGNNQPMVCYGLDMCGGRGVAYYDVEKSPTHCADGHTNAVAIISDVEPVCYGLDRASFNQGKNAKFDISIQEDIAQPLVARGPGGG